MFEMQKLSIKIKKQLYLAKSRSANYYPLEKASCFYQILAIKPKWFPYTRRYTFSKIKKSNSSRPNKKNPSCGCLPGYGGHK